MSSRLTGKWVGKPDTAAAARDRQTKRIESDPEGSSSLPMGDANKKLGATDLEAHDVTIELEFKGDKTVHMALAGDQQPRDGVWRVLTILPPDGAEIEISLNTPAVDADEESDGNTTSEKRRFIVDFDQDGDTPGFKLQEKGADPKFGRLYFVKQM